MIKDNKKEIQDIQVVDRHVNTADNQFSLSVGGANKSNEMPILSFGHERTPLYLNWSKPTYTVHNLTPSSQASSDTLA